MAMDAASADMVIHVRHVPVLIVHSHSQQTRIHSRMDSDSLPLFHVLGPDVQLCAPAPTAHMSVLALIALSSVRARSALSSVQDLTAQWIVLDPTVQIHVMDPPMAFLWSPPR
ncbi:hypothetical protein BGZ47_002456 [Haplosporangium gracile]|nr:hypothetical protein BGZ47_002456 [Haplosporangium gracile]